MQNSAQGFIEKIIAKKRFDLLEKNQQVEASSRNGKEVHSLNFLEVFRQNKSGLIAEVKFASPTNSHLGSPDDVLERVQKYEKAGADAISFITEKYYFKSDTRFIPQIKKTVKLPVLQKDFVIDKQQIYESKELGSDALLLIARLVDIKTLKEFVDLCFDLGIEPVVEINSEEDLEKAILTTTNIIAVNARDLETFEVNIVKACCLLEKIPDQFIKLGFSGIYSAKEVSLYKEAGAKGVLIGTSLMQAKDIAVYIKDLHI